MTEAMKKFAMLSLFETDILYDALSDYLCDGNGTITVKRDSPSYRLLEDLDAVCHARHTEKLEQDRKAKESRA